MWREVRERPVVAVIGGASCSQEEAGLAEAVGGALAERGVLLVCGGGSGVMEAACRGAKAAGGLTVGILSGHERSAANLYVDVVIPSGLGEARNALIVRAAQGVVAVGGEYGTLSEIAFALKRGLPVAGLETWELARAGQRDDAIFRATSAQEAVDWVLSKVSSG